jgi:hypothetical protein
MSFVSVIGRLGACGTTTFRRFRDPEHVELREDRVMTVRDVAELIDVPDPAWPWIRDLVDSAHVPAFLLPVEPSHGRRTLHSLQISAASMMGALALRSGGLLVDHGWLRLLGGGTDGLPDLASANGLGRPDPDRRQPPLLLVAIDVLGGRFAVNQGNLPGQVGDVCYWGPDVLQWHSIRMRYSEFVQWSLGGGLTDFVADLRWNGWEQDVAPLPPGQGLAFVPPLYTRGEGPDRARRSRAPLMKLAALHSQVAPHRTGEVR